MNNINPFFQASQKNGSSLGDEYGSWTTTLKQPLEIMEGDELILNKAILDSRATTSGNIILDQDLTITFDFYYYLINAFTGDNYSNANGGAAWATSDLDLRPYVLQVPAGADPTQDLQDITCRCNATGRQGRDGDQVGFSLQYTDTNNKVQKIHNNLEFDTSVDGSKTWYWSRGRNQPITCIDGSFSIVFDDFTNDEISEWNIDKTTIKTTLSKPSATSLQYTPFTATHSIVLAKGTYSPGDLAERITSEADHISTIDALSTTDPMGLNQLLASTEQGFYNTASTGLYAKGSVWVNAMDGESAFKLNPIGQGTPAATDGVYFGTDSFSLEYDLGLEKFKWNSINFSLYHNSKQSIQFKNLTGSVLRLQNKAGGILFKSINSVYADGTKLNLFFLNKRNNKKGNDGAIGFNSNLIPGGFTEENSSAVGFPAKFMVFQDPNDSTVIELQDGINMTGALTGLDSCVNKNAANPRLLPDFTTSPMSDPIAAPQQEEIFAQGDYQTTNVAFGYYLIAVEGIPTQINSGVDLKQNIVGIVSRYYENDNYTNGSSDDAIVYKHIGMPMTIQGLKIRILKPDYTPADNLGQDNTIFLSLQRSPSNIPALLELQAEQEKKKDSYKK